MEHATIGRALPLKLAICSMELCIIPPNFRRVTEIPQEREHRSGRIDGRSDRRPDAMTDNNTRRRRWRPRVKMKMHLYASINRFRATVVSILEMFFVGVRATHWGKWPLHVCVFIILGYLCTWSVHCIIYCVLYVWQAVANMITGTCLHVS